MFSFDTIFQIMKLKGNDLRTKISPIWNILKYINATWNSGSRKNDADNYQNMYDIIMNN